MKLREKDTGEISEFEDIQVNLFIGGKQSGPFFDSIKELCDRFEDYEEPEGYWYIDDFGRIQFSSEVLDENEGRPNNWMARKLFDNYFETKEEAEKAVEKLKAWKRLRDKGFRFDGYKTDNGKIKFYADSNKCDPVELAILVNLLFGGEE